MAENKTQATAANVADFLDRVEPEARREDAKAMVRLMERLSGEPPVMWGPGIVGFGRYRYRYESGREGEMCRIGFSPRKDALTLYIQDGLSQTDLTARLGKYKAGKSCLYVKRLADIDPEILEQLVIASLAEMERRYPR